MTILATGVMVHIVDNIKIILLPNTSALCNENHCSVHPFSPLLVAFCFYIKFYAIDMKINTGISVSLAPICFQHPCESSMNPIGIPATSGNHKNNGECCIFKPIQDLCYISRIIQTGRLFINSKLKTRMPNNTGLQCTIHNILPCKQERKYKEKTNLSSSFCFLVPMVHSPLNTSVAFFAFVDISLDLLNFLHCFQSAE